MKLRFTVPGKPIAKPRMTRQDKWRQRAPVLRYRAYSNLLRLCALEAGEIPAAESVISLSWVAYFKPPATLNKKRLAKVEKQALLGKLHRAKPDRDNLDKTVLDSLFEQDQAIASGTIEKRWGAVERLEIEIEYEL